MHACEREAVASSFIGIYGCKLKNKNKGLVEKKRSATLPTNPSKSPQISGTTEPIGYFLIKLT
jgi:hypothetical protein